MMWWLGGRNQWNGGHVGGRALVAAVCFICLLNVLASAVHAGPDEKVVAKFVGKNWVNGRSWELLDYSGRLGFVCGLFDGITLFYSMADAGKTGRKTSLDSAYTSIGVPASFTVGDVVNGMDEFYRDTANAQLPAICAYLHFVYKSKGESREALEKRVVLWRKMFPPE